MSGARCFYVDKIVHLWYIARFYIFWYIDSLKSGYLFPIQFIFWKGMPDIYWWLNRLFCFVMRRSNHPCTYHPTGWGIPRGGRGLSGSLPWEHSGRKIQEGVHTPTSDTGGDTAGEWAPPSPLRGGAVFASTLEKWMVCRCPLSIINLYCQHILIPAGKFLPLCRQIQPPFR